MFSFVQALRMIKLFIAKIAQIEILINEGELSFFFSSTACLAMLNY